MRFPAARTMNPSSASGDSTKMAAANTMAATRTLTVVRWVLVAWAVIDFGGVLVVPPLPEDLIREAIILGLSWMIVLLSTYRVKWAALAGAVLIVVSSLTGKYPSRRERVHLRSGGRMRFLNVAGTIRHRCELRGTWCGGSSLWRAGGTAYDDAFYPATGILTGRARYSCSCGAESMDGKADP